MLINHCQSTTPPPVSRLRGAPDGSLTGFDELGQIVPALLVEPSGSANKSRAWAVGSGDMTGTLVEALVRALEARDPYTLGHSIRVGRLAKAIAEELGLSSSEQEEIRLAGALHDIVKIGIEDALLKSEDALSPEGYRRILDHTVIGERILEPMFAQGAVVLQVARSHHESFDGSGFPDRLRGSAIPLPARIVAAADAFDAMTSARAYRDALPLKVATWEMAVGAGKQFDPACVAALLTRLAREKSERQHELRRVRSHTRVVRHLSIPVSVYYRRHLIQTNHIPAHDQRLRITRHSGFG